MLRRGALAGAVAGLSVAVLAAALRLLFGLPLPLEVVSDRFLPFLPVTYFLDLLTYTGGPLISKQLAFFSFFVILAVGGAVLGAAYAAFVARSRFGRRAGIVVAGMVIVAWIVGVLVLLPALDSNYQGLRRSPAAREVAFALLVFLALFAAVLTVVEQFLRRERQPAEAGGPQLQRRTFLTRAAGGVLAVSTAGLVAELYRRSTFGYDGTINLGTSLPPITPNDRFYVVTKNFVDPGVHRSLWRFEVTGRVDRPRTYSFEELAAMPAVQQEMTLECISNGVGGGLISNAVWKGVPLHRLIEAAGPHDDVAWVSLSAPDGFTHSVPAERAMRPTALIAYEMNGEPLPHRHGYPARILLPGTYGEVDVKWVERMELTDKHELGYYERQGWKAERVHTMSRIDAPVKGHDLRRRDPVRVRGVAFAGDRGVSKVEVSTDGGRTWTKAKIDYARSKLTWVMWSLEWRSPRPGSYDLVSRATDGEGALQESKREGVDPDGSSGYHHVSVRVV